MFVTFEGVDGAGKSTQLRLTANYLEQSGYSICSTREPGGTIIGDHIRHILHNVRHTEMTPEAEILLYSASRAQLVRQVIQPRLARGHIVLCDRYAESTYAYQGYGRRLDLDWLRRVTTFATQGLQPDLIIYLDLPITEGLRRKAAAQSQGESLLNRMDRLDRAFYRRVRAGYLTMAQTDPARWLIIEATAPATAIHQVIRQRVGRLAKIRNRRGR